MLLKILGALDLLTGTILILTNLITLPEGILIFCGLVLMAKSLLGFFKDFASWIDFIGGILFIGLTVIAIPEIILIIMGIIILQKGIFSLL